MQDIAAGRLRVVGHNDVSGDEGELFPKVFGGFNGVCFLLEGEGLGDPCWGVPFFKGKSNRIIFRKNGDAAQIAEIEDITLRPAPTMTFLNPRPAADSPGFPWSWDGGVHNHYIKLPIALTYEELKLGSQIVVSGVTDALAVIEGELGPNNFIQYSAGGLKIAEVGAYNGAKDTVQLYIMEDFAGEVLAVNFDKAFKSFSGAVSMDNDEGLLWYWLNGNTIAKCLINGVVFSSEPNYIPSNGLLGNLVFQSQYIQDYGNVIEAYYWANGRYLYVIRVGSDWKIAAINLLSTNSPLAFPVF